MNSFDARLRNAVRSFMHAKPNRDLGALLKAAERERSTIRAILGSASKRNLPSTEQEVEDGLLDPQEEERLFSSLGSDVESQQVSELLTLPNNSRYASPRSSSRPQQEIL
eukprot:IDg6877t1